MLHTKSKPEPIDNVNPANDYANLPIRLITHAIANPVMEGIAQRKAFEVEEEMPEVEDIDLEDEKYLSAATLARLRELSGKEQDEHETDEVA
jgi:ribosomal protein S2